MQEGQILGGKYKLLRKIQSGGQATIYLALLENNELSFSKEVAIKSFVPEEESLNNTLSEIKILTELNHPNIAKIYDVGMHDKMPYIVLEYIDGLNLRELKERLKSKNIPIQPGDVLLILESVLSAIIFAHKFKKTGILHRDISPGNIVISKEGFVKLIDFGISNVPTDKLAGKPAYLPKSILDGKKAYSKSTDFYSLAVVIYEILAKIKVREEKDIDLSLVSDKPSRLILKRLLKCDEAADILKDIQKERIKHNTNLSDLIQKALDEHFIADRTILDIESRTNNGKKKNFTTLTGSLITFAAIITGIGYFYKYSPRSHANLIIEDVATRMKVSVKPPWFEIVTHVSNPDDFSKNACDSYCFNNLAILSSNHKDFYTKEKNNPQFKSFFQPTFKEQLQSFSQIYPALAIHFDTYGRRCLPNSQVCSVANSIFVHIGANAPISGGKALLDQNLMKLLDGKDKKLKRMLERINEGEVDAPKSHKYTFIDQVKGTDYNFGLFDGELSLKICRDIGDDLYLKKSVHQPGNTTKFSTLIFSNVINVRFENHQEGIPYYWIGLINESERSIDICHYQRSNGKIDILQKWKASL